MVNANLVLLSADPTAIILHVLIQPSAYLKLAIMVSVRPAQTLPNLVSMKYVTVMAVLKTMIAQVELA